MSYEIADEPTPSEEFGNLVVDPSAPLLAGMMCGAWLAWPWFIVNAIGIGSPTKRREIQLCLFALGGSIALAFLVFGLVDAGIIESRVTLEIALLGITGFKLGMAYWISTVQARTFHVYEYYGGKVQRAFYVVTAGMYVRSLVLGASDSPLWRIIVDGVM